MTNPKQEKTVVLVKPDGVKRGLIGEVIRRIEQRGLKVVAIKMVRATKEKAHGHYPNTPEWLSGMGNKTLENYAQHGKDPVTEVGTSDPLAIGKMAAGWNEEFLSSGPIVAMIIEGLHAISAVRKIVGSTLPAKADVGTIRGDFSTDSPTLANADRRAIHNLVHASGDEQEASHEVAYWFSAEEIHTYDRADEAIIF